MGNRTGEDARRGAAASHAPHAPHAGEEDRAERERRFLLARAPAPDTVTAARRITDRYVDGTRLRLSRVERLDTGECSYRLSREQPVHPGASADLQLSEQEYARLLAALPGPELTRMRLGVPPLGVDVFEGPLLGLVLAEAEFESPEDAETFVPPPDCVAELTPDHHFTGDHLARTDRERLRAGLAEYGVALP
ncbi:hypothetical protein [Kitasatospora phosalacinea]|uniref:hypothetical protein n=1 Tax=Kitasatospora phosalacinea TaxID=2065 RepID=UPI00068A6EF0|nr:hypothetical protein [Kitasatospora phosalacinea]